MTGVTRSPAQGGLEGCKPSKESSILWCSLPAKPATSTRERRSWGDAQRAPGLPKPHHSVSPVNDTSCAVVALKRHFACGSMVLPHFICCSFFRLQSEKTNNKNEDKVP